MDQKQIFKVVKVDLAVVVAHLEMVEVVVEVDILEVVVVTSLTDNSKTEVAVVHMLYQL